MNTASSHLLAISRPSSLAIPTSPGSRPLRLISHASTAGQAQAVLEIRPDMFGFQAGEMTAHDDTLVEGLMNAHPKFNEILGILCQICEFWADPFS